MARICCFLLLALPCSVWAQDAVEPTPPSDASSSDAPTDANAASTPSAPTDASDAPKLAIVVVGDADEALRAAAQRVESAVGTRLRAPFDPGLRGALRGEAGTADDGLEEVRRERRRLGLDEARDAQLIAALGRRAGASAVAVVRSSANAPELLVLDVRNAAFFEGSLALEAELPDARIAQYVIRRARTAARGTASVPVVAPPRRSAPAAATEPTPEPDFFEQFWPYMVAGLLLAGMITAVALTSTSSDGPTQPVLRFVPGGR